MTLSLTTVPIYYIYQPHPILCSVFANFKLIHMLNFVQPILDSYSARTDTEKYKIRNLEGKKLGI